MSMTTTSHNGGAQKKPNSTAPGLSQSIHRANNWSKTLFYLELQTDAMQQNLLYNKVNNKYDPLWHTRVP